MKPFLLSITLVALVLASCTRDAKVKLPETEEKAVVSCFISPQDSFITVYVTRSQPLYKGAISETTSEIKDALVFFGDESNTILIPYFKENVGYRISATFFPILAGKTYALTIKLNDGKTLSAQTTVPQNQVQDFNLNVQRYLKDSNEFYYSYEYFFNFSWLDLPGIGDQYRILVTGLMQDSTLSDDTLAQTMDERYTQDKERDGTVFQETINVISSYYNENGVIKSIYKGFIGYLIQGNDAYIHYHSDLQRSEFNGPFSEPVINFSNIDGGIGCFAAYSMKRVRVN